MKTLIKYFKILKIPKYFNQIWVWAGALIGGGFDYNSQDWFKLFGVFSVFSLLYSGIYIINDLIDYKKDRQDPLKVNRPIASGEISRKKAAKIASVVVLLSLLTAFKIDIVLFEFELLFLFCNLLYSLILKRDIFFAILGNGIFYPLRLMMGAYIFNGTISVYILFFFFGASVFLAYFKRYQEKKITVTNVKYFIIMMIVFACYVYGYFDASRPYLLTSGVIVFQLIVAYYLFYNKKDKPLVDRIHKVLSG